MLCVRRFFIRFFVSMLIFNQFILYSLTHPQRTHTANLTSASATMSNPRLSYRAGVTSGAINDSSITIDGSGNADNNTNHLFKGDSVCFAGADFSGCSGPTTYTVGNIISTTVFNTTSPLTAALGANDFAMSTQSGTLTIAFTTVGIVPTAGDILITIPAIDQNTQPSDGFPDTSASIATNGFDVKSIAAAQVATTGCTDGNWNTTEVVTAGTAGTDNTIRIDRQTASCAASSVITVTIQNLINPAPVTSGHSQGGADVYQINIKTRDGSDQTIDSVDVAVAPVEAVFVSATVDETLAFTVGGVSADSGSYCGVTRTASSPDTTATALPWGTLPTTYAAVTHNTNHQLTVTTNALSGYKVYAEETDQMGRNGNVCTGVAPSAGEYTFTAGTCIRDTVCQGSACSETTFTDWGSTPTTYYGMGYSLENSSGTDAKFTYNQSAASFNAKQFADIQGAESKTAANAELMTNAGPVSGSVVNVCYRINIPGTQPAGYYYNTVKYTAVSTF